MTVGRVSTQTPKAPDPVPIIGAYQTNPMTYTPSISITGKRIMKESDSARFFVSLAENNEFQQVIESLYDFVTETNADCDMAYDWVCDQLDIQTFVADTYAWDIFFQVYSQAAGLDA